MRREPHRTNGRLPLNEPGQGPETTARPTASTITDPKPETRTATWIRRARSATTSCCCSPPASSEAGRDQRWRVPPPGRHRPALRHHRRRGLPRRRHAHAALARKLCEDCALAQSCRSRARAHREWGTWGGETTAERAAGFTPPDGAAAATNGRTAPAALRPPTAGTSASRRSRAHRAGQPNQAVAPAPSGAPGAAYGAGSGPLPASEPGRARHGAPRRTHRPGHRR
ncbi:WhiB family transcriptional regulator [Streptomyces sp. NPDC059224]|uniref:WhiB family transcriptional regulator n=1 Tax=Streptomyces sp. NPDC059224 TaxID=3346775 RepID=UPI00369E175B